MKKLLSLLLFLFASSHALFAQVPKKTVVEHFTNTRCSICAGRNPGFYTNLANHPDVLHLAIHPSSPYPSCLLNQHNIQENDSRTNYYGVYGSTPQLLINGELISTSANFSSSSIFTPYENLLSPLSIRIEQLKYGTDSIRSKIFIKTVASHTLNNLSLFVALAEDTVFYSSPNGETIHHDVFRKSLTGPTGTSFNIASSVGDSVVYTKSSASNAAWNFSRINTFVILQDPTTKSVIQSEYASLRSAVITGIKTYNDKASNIKIYISDREDHSITLVQGISAEKLNFSLMDLSGRTLINHAILFQSDVINASHVSKGIYLYSLKSENQILKTGKLLLE